MPVGQRGFILRDFDIDVDPSRNPADGRSLWWQHGIAGAVNKTRHIAQALKAADIGHVDYVLMDFEAGLSKSYLDKLNDTAVSAIPNDRRYAHDITALQQNNLSDTISCTWPSPPTKHAMPLEIKHGAWDLDCYRWNDLQRVRVAELLELLAQPLAEAWPAVEVSNYGVSRTMGTIIPDVNGHPVCRYAVGSGTTPACGASILASDSFNMYGTFGQLEHAGWQNNPDRSKFPTTYNSTAANAFRLVLNRARATALARQVAAVSPAGLHVWLQPKEMVIGKTATPMACPALIADPSTHCESGQYWEEAVLHVALSGVTAFGFWGTPAAGATNYTDIRLSNILRELDAVVGAADRSAQNISIISWTVPRALVISAMSLNRGGTTAYRVVCLDGSELSAVEQAGTVELKCDGIDATVLPRSRLVNLTSPVSPMGRWVLQSHTSKTDDVQVPTRSEWHVDPITVKIAHNRRAAFPSSTTAVDLAGMHGECERAQLWVWNDDTDLNVEKLRREAAHRAIAAQDLVSSVLKVKTDDFQSAPVSYARLDLPRRGTTQSDDWLIAGTALPNSTARLIQLDKRTLALTNGLVARVFTLSPEWSTWDVVSAGKGSALRAPAPEAIVTLDDAEYEVGGLRQDLNASAFPSCKASHDAWYPSGQHAEACPTGWWNRSLPLVQNLAAFRYAGHRITAPDAPFVWKQARYAPAANWPPRGLHLQVNFTAPSGAVSQHRDVIVSVHYELLDGAPVMSKWVSIAWASDSHSVSAPSRRRSRARGPLAGPLTIQPCDTSPAAAPAEWGFVWKLPQKGAADASIQLGGKSSGRNICMAVMTASVGFSNADVGLSPCNKSDVMQRWAWDSASSALRTLAPAAHLRAANIRGCLTDAPCCFDINGHTNVSGTCVQMSGCGGDWEGFRPRTSALGIMLQSVESPASCIFSTPVAPSPPLPPPPPPPPPKPLCHTGAGGDCVVVRHVTVEILRLSKAWASAERAMPYEQTDITQDVLPFDSSVGGGLLYIRPTALHGSSVLWSDDMTFRDPDYVATNNVGAVPTVVVGYQSNRSCSADVYGAHKAQCRFGGPGFRLRRGGDGFVSFRALELWSDSAEPERKGFGRRAMTRLLAPQSQEAPFTFHTGTTDESTFKALVLQLSSVGGFDLLMMSFGSGFTMEDTSLENLAKIGELISYSRAHGIEVGGYDLIAEKAPTASEEEFAVVNTDTNASTGALCFASGWRRQITDRVLTWVNNQSLTAIETDGPYGGAVCGSHDHDHYGADDSVYLQQQGQVAFYKDMRAKGVYVNAPDDYLYEGGANKICGGCKSRSPPFSICVESQQDTREDTLLPGRVLLTHLTLRLICLHLQTRCFRRRARTGKCSTSSACRCTTSFLSRRRRWSGCLHHSIHTAARHTTGSSRFHRILKRTTGRSDRTSATDSAARASEGTGCTTTRRPWNRWSRCGLRFG
jgi:hypothetical protein